METKILITIGKKKKKSKIKTLSQESYDLGGLQAVWNHNH